VKIVRTFDSKVNFTHGSRQYVTMSKHLLCFCIATALLVIAAGAAAQVPKGDRIRLEVDPVGKIDGQFVASDDSSVTILSRSSTLRIDRDKIERVQRYQGEHRNWKTGMAIGGGVGLGFGLLIEAVAASEGEGADGAAALSCAFLGAGTGALIGSLFKSDQWKTMPLENLTVSTRVDRAHQLQLVLSASF